jgi:hypothetical protein
MNDVKRSASFLLRAGGLYLSYKVGLQFARNPINKRRWQSLQFKLQTNRWKSLAFIKLANVFHHPQGSQLAIGTSAVVGRWSEARVAEAWVKTNDRGGREVRALAEDFEGYYLKSAQWLGARPDLVRRVGLDCQLVGGNRIQGLDARDVNHGPGCVLTVGTCGMDNALGASPRQMSSNGLRRVSVAFHMSSLHLVHSTASTQASTTLVLNTSFSQGQSYHTMATACGTAAGCHLFPL